MKEIKINNPHNLPTLTLEELKGYEVNKLKDTTKRNVGDLKQTLIKDGLLMPIAIWQKGKFVTDGAQRLHALSMLEYEGWKVAGVPYFIVEAESRKEAKKQAMLISSRYAPITEESAADYLIDMPGIDLGYVDIGLNLEEIEVVEPLKPREPKKKDKGKTVMMHTCPKCGHEFN